MLPGILNFDSSTNLDLTLGIRVSKLRGKNSDKVDIERVWYFNFESFDQTVSNIPTCS